MDLISSDTTYALLLAFGAFAVAVHAYGLYGTPLPHSASVPVSALLENVALPVLGGPRSYNSGFICYLVITEFLYLVLSSSSVILEMSLSVLGNEGTVGALNIHQPDSTLNPLTPVLASSVIMTAGNFKPFSQVENAIRRISHRVAGIPNTAHDALGRINAFRFEPRSSEVPSRSVGAGLQLAAQVRSSAQGSGMNVDDADYLGDCVARIHALEAWTFGRDGERVWSVQGVSALRNKLALVRPALTLFQDRLHARLTAAQVAGASTDDVGEWKQLSGEAQDLKNDLATLFALLLINQPDVRIPEEASQIRRLVRDIQQRDEPQEVNLLFGAVGVGLGVGLVLTTLYYLLTNSWQALFASAVPPTGDTPALSGAARWFALLPDAIASASGDVMSFGLIFVVSTLVATSIRGSRDAAMQWTYWSGRNLPVRQYLSVALTSTLIAFLFFTVYSFWNMVALPSLTSERLLVSPSLLKDFTEQYTDFMPIPMIGLVCAWAVCRTLDRYVILEGSAVHAGSSEVRSALVHAALCGAINALIRLNNGTLDRIDHAFDALLVPALVLLPCFYLFAILYRRFLMRATTGATGSSFAASTARPASSAPVAALQKASTVSLVVAALTGLALLSGPAPVVRAEGHAEQRIIRVGVRGDTKPFAYRGKTDFGETILSGYRGYMIEICRRVLRDVVASEAFQGARIEAVPVSAHDRFLQLATGQVDLLCGPDSITSGRLRTYNVSHPLFISGMTYAYVDPNADIEPLANGFPRGFPRTVYCGNVVGVVRDTTAESVGLPMMARDGVLLRFDEALEVFLALNPERRPQTARAIDRTIQEFKAGDIENYEEFERTKEVRIKRIQDLLARHMETEECPDGFTDGMPVRLFENHDEGIDALCDGRVLYYVGDYDIIRTKIASKGGCAQRVIIQRFTQTREVYGVFFRAGFVRRAQEAIDADRDCPHCDIRDDALLYAVFNHALLRKMQADGRVLDVAYRLEFKNIEKSPDLERFFQSFEVASDLR